MITLSAAVNWPGMMATSPDLPLPAPHSLTISSAISRPIRSQFAPTKAVEGLVRLKVYLKHLDALGFSLLDLTGQELNGRIVHDEHVRLVADGLGEQLRHRSGVERRVADIDAVAINRRVLLHAARPRLGQSNAHRDRHEDDLLAGDVAVGLRAALRRVQASPRL